MESLSGDVKWFYYFFLMCIVILVPHNLSLSISRLPYKNEALISRWATANDFLSFPSLSVSSRQTLSYSPPPPSPSSIYWSMHLRHLHSLSSYIFNFYLNFLSFPLIIFGARAGCYDEDKTLDLSAQRVNSYNWAILSSPFSPLRLLWTWFNIGLSNEF